MEEASSEEEEAEDSVAVQSGGESLDDPGADGDSLGERSIASVPGTVLSDTSLPVTSLVLSTQAAQPAATKSRRRPSSSSSSSARSTSRSILNQSGADDDEDFEQEAFTSPPAVSQSKKRRARPPARPSSGGSSGDKRKKKKKRRKSKSASVNLAPLQGNLLHKSVYMPSRFIFSVSFTLRCVHVHGRTTCFININVFKTSFKILILMFSQNIFKTLILMIVISPRRLCLSCSRSVPMHIVFVVCLWAM